MIDLSLAGLAGACLGIVLAALIYAPLLAAIERRFCEASDCAKEDGSADELPLLRRAILAVDMVVFAGAGYWLGQRLAG